MKDIYRAIGCGLKISTAAMICILIGLKPVCASENLYRLNIPAAGASEALNRLAEATGHSLFYPTDDLTSVTTNALDGSYTLPDALDILLKGTHLNAVVTEKGVIVISTAPDTQQNNSDEGSAMKESPKKLSILAGIATFFAAMVTTPDAAGQESQGSGAQASAIEEIIVSARKREENIQEIPISITAFSGEQLEARGIRDLNDLAEFAPNVNFQRSGGLGGVNRLHLFIRGIGQIGVFINHDPAVGVYIDGVYFARIQGGVLDVVDLERAEILRGPQGTLFGRNTIAGAINLVSRKPHDNFEGYATVELGNYDTINTRFSVNVPVTENLFAMISGSTRDHDGYVTSLQTGEKQADANDQVVRAALRWLPHEDLTVDLIGDYSRRRAATNGARQGFLGPNAIPPIKGIWGLYALAGFDPFSFTSMDEQQTNSTFPTQDDHDIFGGSLHINWDLGWARMTSITGYRELQQDNFGDNDGTPITITHTKFGHLRQDQFTQEIQLTGLSLDDRLNWVAGLFYYNEDIRDISSVARQFGDLNGLLVGTPAEGAFPPPLPESQQIFNIGTENFAAFFEGTYDFTRQLSATVGVRWGTETKDASLGSFELGSTTVPFTLLGEVPVANKETWDSWTPRFQLQFRPTEEILTYASVSRGFKGGTFNNFLRSDTAFDALEPEKVWSYEIGVKSDLFHNRIRLNLAGFYSDYTDQQLVNFEPVPNRPGAAAFRNIGESEIYGFELEFVARPFEQFTIDGGLGYTKATFTEPPPNTGAPDSGQVPNVPKWTGNIAATWTLPVSDAGHFRTRIDYTYRSKQFNEITNNPNGVIPGYGIANLRGTFEHSSKKWEIALWARNLFDKGYDEGLFYVPAFDLALNVPGDPLTYGASLTYRF